MIPSWTSLILAAALQTPPPQESTPQEPPPQNEPSTTPLTLRSATFKWEVTLPAGYAVEKKQADLDLYKKSLGNADWEWMRFAVRTLSNPIQQQKLSKNSLNLLRGKDTALPPDAKIEMKTYIWEGLEIFGAEYSMVDVNNNLEIFGATVVVPLTPRALQLDVVAAKVHEDRVRAELKSILPSVKGTTNWIKPGDAQTLQYLPLPGYAAAGLAVIYLVLWAVVYRTNPWLHHRLRLIWLLVIGGLFFSSFMLAMTYGEVIERVGEGAPVMTWPLICIPAMLTYVSLGLRRIYIYNEG